MRVRATSPAPPLIIWPMVTLPVPKTMTFGGAPACNMKEQVAAKATGINRLSGKSMPIATSPGTGMNVAAVDVRRDLGQGKHDQDDRPDHQGSSSDSRGAHAEPVVQPRRGDGACEAEPAAEQQQNAPGQPVLGIVPVQHHRAAAMTAQQEQHDAGADRDGRVV